MVLSKTLSRCIIVGTFCLESILCLWMATTLEVVGSTRRNMDNVSCSLALQFPALLSFIECSRMRLSQRFFRFSSQCSFNFYRDFNLFVTRYTIIFDRWTRLYRASYRLGMYWLAMMIKIDHHCRCHWMRKRYAWFCSRLSSFLLLLLVPCEWCLCHIVLCILPSGANR